MNTLVELRSKLNLHEYNKWAEFPHLRAPSHVGDRRLSVAYAIDSHPSVSPLPINKLSFTFHVNDWNSHGSFVRTVTHSISQHALHAKSHW